MEGTWKHYDDTIDSILNRIYAVVPEDAIDEFIVLYANCSRQLYVDYYKAEVSERSEHIRELEKRIDELFLDQSTPENAYRLETYRSTGSVSATASQQLRCYFVSKCNFPANAPTSTLTDGYATLC